MADWTANSGWGAPREPVYRTRREPQLGGEAARPEPRLRAEAAASRSEPRAESLRADPRAPSEETAPRLRPGAAALSQYNAALSGPLAKARFAVWAGGGALSLLLIGGVGIWGYKLVLREVMGLPVVAAETGPMRVLPSDPEGEVVPSQGLAVNAIPAAGTAAAPSDVLVLAPQAPGLAEEDMVVVQSNAEAGEVMPAMPVEPAAPATATVAAVPVSAAPVATVAAAPLPSAAALAPAGEAATLTASAPTTLDEVMAMADRVAAGAQVATPAATVPAALPTPVEAAPLAAATAPASEAVALAVPAATVASAVPATPDAPTSVVAAIPDTVPGVASAPRPAPRPASLGTAPAVAATAVAGVPAAEAAPVPAAPAASAVALTTDLPSGTHLVQLGAFDSAEIAAAEWDRLQSAFGEFLGGRERVIQETQSDGRTFYRLRAMGFSDRADARILCAALTAEDAACIPVTVD